MSLHLPEMKSDTRPSVELEATLVVSAPDPVKVLAHITKLHAIADFELNPTAALRIRDLYFDTRDSDLRERGWGLRVRTVGSEKWVTLKGSPTVMQWGAVAYKELEREWSRDGFSQVRRHLAEIGVRLGAPTDIFDPADPLGTMKTAGLAIIQDRETYRQVREVFGKGPQKGRALAELVVDSVTYRFQGFNISHHELEIETRRDDAGPVIMEIQEALLAKFGPVLRPWVHSKLATGWAIERLMSSGHMDDAIRTGTLMPAAYDTIEAFLVHV